MEDWFYERLKKVIKTPFKKENEMLKNDETIVLNFLYNRLIEKYGENENYDYMIKFREIINSRVGETKRDNVGGTSTGERVGVSSVTNGRTSVTHISKYKYI
jgi:hypothetical protein